jgi:hemolysin III
MPWKSCRIAMHMALLLPARTAYSRAEDTSDAVVHVSGIAVGVIAAPVLVVLAALLHGSAQAVVAASVYAAAMVAMLICSALYNMARAPGRKALFRRFDHTAILCKIAATYMPFLMIPGTQGTGLLAGLWTAAIAGAGFRLFAPDRRVIAVVLALGMGWAGLFAGEAFFAGLSTAVIVLIVIGGSLYTLGAGFFLFDRLPFHYTAWHVCVLVATMVFYAAVITHLVQTGA